MPDSVSWGPTRSTEAEHTPAARPGLTGRDLVRVPQAIRCHDGRHRAAAFFRRSTSMFRQAATRSAAAGHQAAQAEPTAKARLNTTPNVTAKSVLPTLLGHTPCISLFYLSTFSVIVSGTLYASATCGLQPVSCRLQNVNLRLQHANKWQLAVVFGEIQAVAARSIGHFKTGIVDRDFDSRRVRLSSSVRSAMSPGGAGGACAAGNPGAAGADDVLDNDDVAPVDGFVQIFQNAHHTAAFGALAMAGACHEVDRPRQVDVTNQIGQEQRRAFKHGDEQDFVAGKIGEIRSPSELRVAESDAR